jgi:hypothetical protein
VRFRNIWYRPLPKRFVDGGEYSRMSEEATAAKRAEIAQGIREDSAKLEGNAKMLRLFESLCYAENAEAKEFALAAVSDFAAAMKAVPADKIESKKGEILQVTKALRYLAQFKILAEEPAARQELEAIIKANDWEPKKK